MCGPADPFFRYKRFRWLRDGGLVQVVLIEAGQSEKEPGGILVLQPSSAIHHSNFELRQNVGHSQTEMNEAMVGFTA